MPDGPSRLVARRRRRSVRACVATLLLAVAAASVAGAAASGDLGPAVVAGALAVVLGAAATRVVWTEVLWTRRWAAFDRARQNEAHAAESTARSAGHTAVVAGMGAQLSRSHRDVERLYERLAVLQRRLARRPLPVEGAADAAAGSRMLLEGQLVELRAEVGRVREALTDARRAALTHRHRAEALRAEVAVLQEALVEKRAEDADELASWVGPHPDGVVRLAAWSDRRQA